MMIKRVLKDGMSGDDVREIQILLKNKGFYKGVLDNYFSQNLVIAVKNYQKSVNIADDGVVGIVTWNNLHSKNLTCVQNKETFANREFNIYYVNEKGFKIYDYLLHDDEYFKEKTEKKFIFLHHTAGSYRPDYTINAWENDCKKCGDDKKAPIKIATSYVVGRASADNSDISWDGKVLRAFDDSFWAYHLGLNNNSVMNKISIGIEVCNYGQLTLGRDGQYYNYVNKVMDKASVVKLDKPFRGYQFFERYTNNQLKSLRTLLLVIANKYNIQIDHKNFNKKWFDYDEKWLGGSGIRSHAQVRRDKVDVFPQDELIDMLNTL